MRFSSSRVCVAAEGFLVFIFLTASCLAVEHRLYTNENELRLRLDAALSHCGLGAYVDVKSGKALPITLTGPLQPSTVDLPAADEQWLAEENLALRLRPGSHLRVENAGIHGFTVHLNLSFGVVRPLRPEHMRRFRSSGEIEHCFVRVLDDPTVVPSEYAYNLFMKIIRRFTLIQASIDQGVSRSRVAEMLAEAQVLTEDLEADESAGSFLTLSRELLSAYSQENRTGARPRLDEIRRRYTKPPPQAVSAP